MTVRADPSSPTSNAVAAALTDGAASDAGPEAISRIVWRLIPYLCLLFIVNYLDRTNVAMAKLQMLGDIHISEAVYGFGAGLFFVGYFIFEVPSNLIMERVGARIWMARIMFTWGVISAAMFLVRGAWSFYTLRFLLGVAEAGFYPGIVLYLTYWIPARQRTGVLAAFLTSTAISGVVGNPLAGALMKLDGFGGMHGWQWLFLTEGIMPIILGFVTLWLLPDRPEHAKWLSPVQRDWIAQQLARDDHECADHVKAMTSALRHHRLWLLAALYFMLIMGLYGFIYWMPAIIKSISHASDMHVGLLSAVPYLVAVVTMVPIAHHADRHNERRWHVVVTTLIAAAGIAIVTRCETTVSVMLALCFAAIGIWGSLAPFWALSTRFLRGTAAAGGIAIVNSIGALSGFVAPSVIGYAKTVTGHYTAGLYVVSAALVCAAVLVLCVPKTVDRGIPEASS